MALDAGSVLLYQLIPGTLLTALLCLALSRAGARHTSSALLRAPLLSGDTVEHRVDAAMRDAEAGFSLCPGCEFENFKRTAYCSLCGERLPLVAESSEEGTGGVAPPPAVETPNHARQLRTQQIRVRKRKEWTRKLDVEGKMFWFRASVSHSGAGGPAWTSQCPGVSVVFRPPLNEAVPPKEDGVETVSAAGLVKADASVRMELLSSDAADPVMRATGVALAVSPERLKELLATAAQDFPTKYAHFVASTAALMVPAEVEYLKLTVHREYMLEQSVDHVGCIQEKNIHSFLRINFIDESGVDAGGVHREWFLLLNEMLLNPSLALFRCCNTTEQTYYLDPNAPDSALIGDQHLTYYFVAGRLVGRALLEGQMLGFHLALPLLKIVLGIPVTFSDLEYLDPEAYRSMVWLRENDGVESLGLDFSVTEKRGDGDAVVTVDLIPNGRNIDVTDANKLEYLERRFRYLVFESVSTQLNMFLRGVYEVIPQELLMIFDPEEFDFLLCGTQEIDVDNWEANSQSSSDLRCVKTLTWFWEVVREMPNEYRRRLLLFATGSSRVPLSGFAGLTSYDGRLCPFSLKGVSYDTSRYISSHACFNRLDLPLYPTKSELRTVLYATLDTDLYGFTTA